MKGNIKRQFAFLLIIIVLVALLAPLGSIAAGENVVGEHAPQRYEGHKFNPVIVPPDESAFGKTYGEWAAEWWKWSTSIPADEYHPLIADGKMDCGIGQHGKVWFLGGAHDTTEVGEMFLAEADRKCTVPAGRALFFPIVNIMCSDLSGDGTTEEELAGCANYVTDTYVYPVSLKIDGVEFGDLEDFRTVSDLFSYGPLPDPPIVSGDPGDEGIGVTGGYYVLVAPLQRGNHKIEFVGEIIVPEWDYHFRVDIRYRLKVR